MRSDGEKELLSKTLKTREEREHQLGTKRELIVPTKSEKHSISKRSTQLEHNSLHMDIDFYLSTQLLHLLLRFPKLCLVVLINKKLEYL